MKRNSFGFTVFLRTSKMDHQGLSPLYGRITVNRKRVEFSLLQKLELKDWKTLQKGGNPRRQDLRRIKDLINSFELRIQEVYRELIRDGKEPRPDLIRDLVLGLKKKTIGIVEFYEVFLERVKKQLGIDFAINTFKSYKLNYKHIRNFVRNKYGKNDFPIEDIHLVFIEDFFYYLRIDCQQGHNTALMGVRRFNRIIRLARRQKLITENPLEGFDKRLEKKERPFLSLEELKRMENAEIKNLSEEKILDFFIFCCYTGLAFSDAHGLSKEHIVKGIDGGYWIRKPRQKTKVMSTIPLLPKANEILKKYEKFGGNGFLLPQYQLSQTNKILKEIGIRVGIKKKVTTHIARHTFATTVTLANHVSMEAVSRMLGHSSIRMTKEYAKIVDQYLSEEVQKLKEKFG